MACSIQKLAAAVPGVFNDSSGKTTPLLEGFAARAVLQRYSLDAPLEVVSDVEGNGTNYVPTPVAPGEGGDLPVWESNFSVIRQIEYPVMQQPPQLILDSDYRIYHTPGQPDRILINFDTPPPGDVLRVIWTARHLADGSTVPDRDFFAVVDFTASLAAEWLASYYIGVGDPTMNVDVVNYRTKSQEVQGVAKMLRKRYFNHMGIEEGAAGDGEVQAAFALGNQYLEQNSGVDRLVHDKYSR
ncbi:MAG TPA: hypothetical protein VHX37_13510 [Acidobacteriaceae bacterium]|jgi:hypothetical protein|nr:hypothetical protein [Acidobacteriaceae bacterium]